MAELSLGDDMTVFCAEMLHQDLVAAMAGDEPVVLDLSEVQELDTSGLQLLLAVRRMRLAAGLSGSVPVTSVSEMVRTELAQLDLSELVCSEEARANDHCEERSASTAGKEQLES